MIVYLRGCTVGLGCLILAALFVGMKPAHAQDEKELAEGIVKLAAAIEKKDAAQIKTLVSSIAGKNDTDVIMPMFRLRSKKGVGVGAKPGAIDPKLDGIEKMLTELAKKPLTPAQLAEQSGSLTEMGYAIAAIAQLTRARAPKKDDGPKKVKDWLSFTEQMEKAGLDLAIAARSKDPAGVKKAASINDRSAETSTCEKCHVVFME